MNQNSAIGIRIVAASVIAVGRDSISRNVGARCNSGTSMAQPSRMLTSPQTTLPKAANSKGRREGFWCSAKIKPPIEGASSLAAAPGRAAPAGRRLAVRRPDGGWPGPEVSPGDAGRLEEFVLNGPAPVDPAAAPGPP